MQQVPGTNPPRDDVPGLDTSSPLAPTSTRLPTLSIERWGWDCGGPHGAEAPLSVEELHPTCRQSSLSLVPGPARVAGSGPLTQAEVRPCPPVTRSDRAEERRPRSPGRRAESSDRESGVRRHRILSTAQMGFPARAAARARAGARARVGARVRAGARARVAPIPTAAPVARLAHAVSSLPVHRGLRYGRATSARRRPCEGLAG